MQSETKPLTLPKEPVDVAKLDAKPIDRVRSNLYAGIKVSVKTMDKIIFAVSALLVLAIILGIVIGR